MTALLSLAARLYPTPTPVVPEEMPCPSVW